jgi:hypothetical protein
MKFIRSFGFVPYTCFGIEFGQILKAFGKNTTTEHALNSFSEASVGFSKMLVWF